MSSDLPIRVDHPRRLGTWTIEAERLDLGEGYKPSLALLPGGELVLVSLDNTGDPEAGTWTEVMPLRRSLDHGAPGRVHHTLPVGPVGDAHGGRVLAGEQAGPRRRRRR